MQFYYGIDGVAGFSYCGNNYYYKKNAQNDIIAIFDANNVELCQYIYDAWGNHKSFVKYETTFLDISIPENYNLVKTNIELVLSQINPFRYRGYYYDNETGLYYLNSRYYDQEIGRFINADELSYLNENNINGMNLFSYCRNNPVIYFDPSGKSLLAIFLILLATTAAGAATSGVIAYNNGSRGWDLVGKIALGGLMGFAGGGLLLASSAAILGAIGFTRVFGVGVFQTFAIGALAYNLVAFAIAPILGIKMEGIDINTSKTYDAPYKYDEYYYPSNYVYKNKEYSNHLILLVRRILSDRILWGNI